MILIEERVTKKVPGETSLFISYDYNQEIVDYFRDELDENLRYLHKTKDGWEVEVVNTSLSDIIDKLILIDDITLKFMSKSSESNE